MRAFTPQEDAVVDSVVAVFREHPEIVEKLGGLEGLGDVIADQVFAIQDAWHEPPALLPVSRRGHRRCCREGTGIQSIRPPWATEVQDKIPGRRANELGVIPTG